MPLDIHKRFSRAVSMGADGEILSDERISHSDASEMERFFESLEPGTDVVMEATFNWPWIADLAEEAGLVPHLGDPFRIREYSKGLGKSDRKDAVAEGKLWLAGIFPEAYLAPPEVRRMRGLFRLRLVLVGMRTAMKNTIHGQLHRMGILIDECSDLFSVRGRGILEELEASGFERSQLKRKLEVIDDLDRHIGSIGSVIRRDLKADERGRLLMTLPGVGELTAYSLLAEIGEIERFANGRALAAYAGVLPLENESADKDYGKRTGWHCNRFLRWAAIEAVSGAVRSSPRMNSLHSRVRARNAKRPGKARVAVARELLELAHLILTRRVPYTETPPPRPGSNRRKAKSR